MIKGVFDANVGGSKDYDLNLSLARYYNPAPVRTLNSAVRYIQFVGTINASYIAYSRVVCNSPEPVNF